MLGIRKVKTCKMKEYNVNIVYVKRQPLGIALHNVHIEKPLLFGGIFCNCQHGSCHIKAG